MATSRQMDKQRYPERRRKIAIENLEMLSLPQYLDKRCEEGNLAVVKGMKLGRQY